MRNFRLLEPGEIECRISQVGEKGVSVLLYKTARTDYALFDETFGQMNWQNDYKVIDGKMYCGIGVKDDATGEWVWKWNCGTESNTEAEKGQASDAMKRAGFAWGCGAELYTAPNIRIWNERLESRNQNKVYDRFYVRDIRYNEKGEICALTLCNHKGSIVYQYPENRQQNAPPPQEHVEAPPTRSGVTLYCKDCGQPIDDKVHDFSVRYYGAPYCRKCQKNHAR